MIAFVFALLLALFGGHSAPASLVGPAPAVSPTPAPDSVARAGEAHAPGHHPGAVVPPAPVVTTPQAPAAPTTVPAPRTYFPQTWTVVTPPPAPTDLPPVPDGWTDGPMCTDPVDCPPGS